MTAPGPGISRHRRLACVRGRDGEPRRRMTALPRVRQLLAALCWAQACLLTAAFVFAPARRVGPAALGQHGVGGRAAATKAAGGAWVTIPPRRPPTSQLYSSVKTEPQTQQEAPPGAAAAAATVVGTRKVRAVAPPGKGVRAQRLKDLLLEKELRNDISTAEFALTLDLPRVEARPGPAAPAGVNATVGAAAGGAVMMTPGGVVDYEKIAEKLEKNLELIDRRQVRWSQVGRGAAGEEATVQLTQRLNETRAELKNVLRRVRASMAGGVVAKPASPPAAAGAAGAGAAPAAGAAEAGGEGGERPLPTNPFTVFVREDGTVDWDGAIQSGKDLAKFSGDLLVRLQGRSPGDEEAPAPKPSATLAAIDARPAIKQLTDYLRVLQGELREADGERNRIAGLHRALRQQGLEVTKAQKGELRVAEDQALELRRRVELQKLDVDMERICAYIEQEIEQSTSVREQRMLVAEFGLLDAQLGTLLTLLRDAAELEGASTLLELDEEELKVVASEVQDLKTRLGLVDEAGGQGGSGLPKVDLGSVQAYIQENVEKVRKGVSFFVTGGKLIASDVQYAAWLISRAAQGYTLKPREVRTLQRTAKDLLTLIPFVIILIIPLTPVGHVLIFGLIQRIFPDFFPSSFTERRQLLARMYDELDKKPLVEPPLPPSSLSSGGVSGSGSSGGEASS